MLPRLWRDRGPTFQVFKTRKVSSCPLPTDELGLAHLPARLRRACPPAFGGGMLPQAGHMSYVICHLSFVIIHLSYPPLFTVNAGVVPLSKYAAIPDPVVVIFAFVSYP